jgi:hypothetical protein
MTVHAKDARLGFDALPIADGILLEAVVGHFTGCDAELVFLACGGQVDDVGGGDVSADSEEALVLREEVVEVGHGELRFDDGSVVAEVLRRCRGWFGRK